MNRNHIFLWIMITLLLPFVSSGEPPDFDGNQAFTFLYKQVELGPRIPGSKSHDLAVTQFSDWFEQCGGQVILQRFSVDVPVHYSDSKKQQTVDGVNVIARFGSADKIDYLFCAHYDTRPWADHDPDLAKRDQPIDGANDGASGVAVLLELARLFSIEPPPVTVELVLFDVEDSGAPGDNESYCLGSAYYSRNYAGEAPLGAILLDMVGDESLEIPKEYFSYAYSRSWTDYLFDLASELGLSAFVDEVGDAVYDDHVNLIRNGIPTCNFIDFDYAPWHTHGDVPGQCSPESLSQVGTLLRALVYGEN